MLFHRPLKAYSHLHFNCPQAKRNSSSQKQNIQKFERPTQLILTQKIAANNLASKYLFWNRLRFLNIFAPSDCMPQSSLSSIFFHWNRVWSKIASGIKGMTESRLKGIGMKMKLKWVHFGGVSANFHFFDFFFNYSKSAWIFTAQKEIGSKIILKTSASFKNENNTSSMNVWRQFSKIYFTQNCYPRNSFWVEWWKILELAAAQYFGRSWLLDSE